MRDLDVERHQLRLARGDRLLEGGHLLVGDESLLCLGQLTVELQELRVEAVHRVDEVGLTELDVANARRFKDAAARVLVHVHLHHLLVDGGIDDDPRAAAQLAVWRDVGEDRVLVRAQVVDDLGAKLENLAKHVAGAAGEAAPVCKDDEREVLGGVEVGDGLGGLESRVRVPDLACLGEDSLAGDWVGRISGDNLLDEACLNGDDAHGYAAEPSASNDDALAPVGEVLGEGARVEESGLEGAISAGGAGEHVAGVVGRGRRDKANVALDGVG
mmetsp:Transcript_18274/g.36935  ORF Transcript_18274/g.36935 Transcript_18274/m.36935 type:complete len:272 (-) Transcript_18274:915-1730(-)